MKCFFSAMEWFPECRDGGLDRYFYEQLQALADLGVSGSAAVSFCEPNSIGEITVRPMAERKASLFQRWRSSRAIARSAFQEGVDVVNAHFALYAFPYLRDIPAGVPFIVNFQGPWAGEIRAQSKSWKRRLVARFAQTIEGRVYRRADRVITLSEAFKKLVHEQYGVPLERVRVIPGALNLNSYLNVPSRSEARQQLGWPAGRRMDGWTERRSGGAEGRTILLSVRRLAKRMGLEMLIDAIAEVRTEFPEVLLLIGGKGPEAERLNTRIAERQLGENVRMLGFIPEADLPTCYAAADCSIVPTLALEGFGLITVESLASGTPVLGTPVGATPEILQPFDPELVFNAPTVPALAAKLRQVLSGHLRLPTSDLCRSYAQRYGWPEVVPKILDVYHEAILQKKCLSKISS